MVGFRVFDLGLLAVWLIWFFRLRDDDDSSEDDGPGGGGPDPRPGGDRGPGGVPLPLGRTSPGRRRRDHPAPRQRAPRRGLEPLPPPLPSRVRRPASPAPVHRRA